MHHVNATENCVINKVVFVYVNERKARKTNGRADIRRRHIRRVLVSSLSSF